MACSDEKVASQIDRFGPTQHAQLRGQLSLGGMSVDRACPIWEPSQWKLSLLRWGGAAVRYTAFPIHYAVSF